MSIIYPVGHAPLYYDYRGKHHQWGWTWLCECGDTLCGYLTRESAEREFCRHVTTTMAAAWTAMENRIIAHEVAMKAAVDALAARAFADLEDEAA